MSKTESLLGGFMYVIHRDSSASEPARHLVLKLPSNGSPEVAHETYEIKDGECSCTAAQFGNRCKHLDMVAGTLVGKGSLTRNEATDVLESFFDKVRAAFPEAQGVSLVALQAPGPVSVATGIACRVLSDEAPERMTIWAETQGILVRVHCFKSYRNYKEALRRARAKLTTESAQTNTRKTHGTPQEG